jgi:renal tumor antigen
MRKYRLVAKKGEGTFSEVGEATGLRRMCAKGWRFKPCDPFGQVLKAQNIKDGKYHAIKCMKNRFDSIDQVSTQRTTRMLCSPCLLKPLVLVLERSCKDAAIHSGGRRRDRF